MFGIIVAVALTVEVVVLVVLGFVFPGAPFLPFLAPVVPLTLGAALLLRSRLIGGIKETRRLYGWHRLSPESIAGYRPRPSGPRGPEEISRSIVERAGEIRRSLAESPLDEVRVDMCALGYGACVNDMIILTQLVNEELKNAGPLRRAKLLGARKKATAALAAARDALPPGALRESRQEQQ